MFKAAHEHWKRVNVFFIDRDFTQIGVLEAEWPAVPLLICAFHVMKTLKFNIAKEKLHVAEKQFLLSLFKRALYSRSVDAFKEKEAEFLDECPFGLREYYERNWAPDPETWSFAYRDQLRTFGKKTTNRIERFF